MLWVLRIALYVQVLLGLGRLFGLITNTRVWETHISLGILITVLALIAFRPVTGVVNDSLRMRARFAPIVPLALGLAMFGKLLSGMPIVVIHMLLGLTTVALVEMAAGRQRRASGSSVAK